MYFLITCSINIQYFNDGFTICENYSKLTLKYKELMLSFIEKLYHKKCVVFTNIFVLCGRFISSSFNMSSNKESCTIIQKICERIT